MRKATSGRSSSAPPPATCSRSSRQPRGFRATRAPVTEEVRTVLRAGEIRSSLFGAADAAGIPDQITLALADVFAGDIDFYHDLRRGDRFTVLYEMRLVDGEPVGAGRILAAEFVNGGKTLSAFRWRDAEGTEGYFTADGRNTRGAFLRSPMEFSRITSGFSLARMHPILNTWRAHKGVDYGAPMGTPVRATADGIVTFAGVQGGYGNVIFVRHHGSYSTVYGHLSRFAPSVKNGARVTQGETIGFVGRTGWATGPHLHYEFRMADQPRDPLTVALPVAQPIAPEHQAAFRSAIAPHAASLALAQALPGAALAAGRVAGWPVHEPARRARARSALPGAHDLPMSAHRELFAGVMSGTSLDGVDAVLADFSPGAAPCTLLAATHIAFPTDLRARTARAAGAAAPTRSCARRAPPTRWPTSTRMRCAACASRRASRAHDVVAAGVHGQTVRHRPHEGWTLQINNPARVAEHAYMTVVADFRARDIAAGGQGAPLVPAFHAAMFGAEIATASSPTSAASPTSPICRPRGLVRGFDTGPGNVLLDLWHARHRGARVRRRRCVGCDRPRRAPDLLAALLAEPYFALPPPKSTGRDLFHAHWLDAVLARRSTGTARPEDVQATLSALTARTLADAVRAHAEGAAEVLVCGGGARNPVLMAALARELPDLRVRATDRRWRRKRSRRSARLRVARARSAGGTSRQPACGDRSLGAASTRRDLSALIDPRS